MKLIKDKLEVIDIFFSSKKKSEKWLIILSIAGIIFYLCYAYLSPYTDKVYKKSEISKKSVEKRIANNNAYLKSITKKGDLDFHIKEFDHKIVTEKNTISDLNQKIEFVNKNLTQLPDMVFKQKNWSKFLDYLANEAKMQNIDMHSMKNRQIDNDGRFGPVLKVSIKCVGEYRDIIKFMNEIEQTDLLTDIDGTRLFSDMGMSNVVADINISVWGVNN